MLLENGLLDYNEEEATIMTTAKGFKFLGLYGQLDKLSPGQNSTSTLSSIVTN
jgi:hypothetical protein